MNKLSIEEILDKLYVADNVGTTGDIPYNIIRGVGGKREAKAALTQLLQQETAKARVDMARYLWDMQACSHPETCSMHGNTGHDIVAYLNPLHINELVTSINRLALAVEKLAEKGK